MGLLRKLFSLFRQEQSGDQNSKSILHGTTYQAFYPKDHILTGQERKDFSNQFLRRKDVPTLDHLPLIEDHTEARFRNQEEVAAKAVVLYGLIYVANKARPAREMIDYFKGYKLWNCVSPEEREYLQMENRTAEDNNPVTWRIENLNVLLWALGNFEHLSFPTTMCSFDTYNNLPNLNSDPTAWIQNARLRNTEEILNETDLIYRIHWATRNALLKGMPAPAGLNEDIITERHFAFNWLTMYEEEWDDITTDT